jgi:hypothetical protein
MRISSLPRATAVWVGLALPGLAQLSSSVSRADQMNTSVATVVNSASFVVGSVAPNELVSAFGSGFSSDTVLASTQPLPTTLGDTTIAVTDSSEDGLARAYNLRNLHQGDPFSGAFEGMPLLHQVEENFKTYFYITKEGMGFHAADDTWWPFDDEGKRRPDWHLDE